MKQFYFGNVFEKNGYAILASSSGIPKKVLQKAEKCCVPFSDLKENRANIGMVSEENFIIYFCTSFVPPKIEKGENRPTYFTHAYIAGDEDINFIAHMPNVLENIKFRNNYSANYDVSDTEVNISRTKIQHTLSEAFLNEAGNAVRNNSHIVIFGENITYEKALKLIIEISENLRIEERRKLSFIALADEPNEMTERVKFIFSSKADKFKSKYGGEYKYYNIDTKNMENTKVSYNDIVINGPKQNTYNEPPSLNVNNSYSMPQTVSSHDAVKYIKRITELEDNEKKLKRQLKNMQSEEDKLIQDIEESQKIIQNMKIIIAVFGFICVFFVTMTVALYCVGFMNKSENTDDQNENNSHRETVRENSESSTSHKDDPNSEEVNVQPSDELNSGEGDAPKDDITQPDGTRLDGSQPNGTQPDGSQPDGSQPDGSQPDGSQPDGTQPDGSQPDSTQSDGVQP